MLLASVVGIYHFWVIGPSHIENVASVFEASFKIDSLKHRKDISEMMRAIENDQTREGIKILDEFENDVKNIDSVEHTKESYKKLTSSLAEMRTSLNNLLSLPNLTTFLFVFNEKVAKFEKLSLKENWPTLTRMSRKMKARLNSKKVSAPGFFSYTKLKGLSHAIGKSLKVMKNTVNTSALSNSKKQFIKTKLAFLESDFSMLKQYTEWLKESSISSKKLGKHSESWIKKVGPRVYLKRMRFEENSHILLTALFIVVIFLVFSIVAGILIFKQNRIQTKHKVEDIILNVFKETIIPKKMKIHYKFSDSFFKEVDELRDYLHKRMSFGAIFQEVLPISAILLDSNLKIIWANALFYNQWNFSHKKSYSNLMWDDCRKFTNLGERDPIGSALTNNNLSSCQIRVQPHDKKASSPFEMLVSPIDTESGRKVMVLFYPLKSLEKTLMNQAKSLVGPITKCLDAFFVNGLSGKFKKEIKKEFEMAHIGYVYEKFSRCNELINEQRDCLLKEIETLENDLIDKYKLIEDFRICLSKKMAMEKETIGVFNETKKRIVSNIDVRFDIEHFYDDFKSAYKNFFKDKISLLKKSREMDEVLQKNENFFQCMLDLKTDFKSIRKKLDESKLRLVQCLNHDNLNKVKLEVKALDEILEKFSQKAISLDITLSKMDLTMEHRVSPDFDAIESNLSQHKDAMGTYDFNMNKSHHRGQLVDEELVASLKNLYERFSVTLKQSASLRELIADTSKVPKKGATNKRQNEQSKPRGFDEDRSRSGSLNLST